MHKTVLFCFLLIYNLGHSATFTCTSSGVWNLGATWGNSGDNVEGSGYPGAGDDVLIKGDATVTVNISTAKCDDVQLGWNSNPSKGDGTLVFNTGSQLTSTGVISFGDGGKSGYLSMTNGGTLLSSSWSGKKGAITSGTGTVKFTGNFTLQNDAGFSSFYNLDVAGNVNLATALTINKNLTLTSGTLDPSQKGIMIKGDWINNGGAFDEGTHNNEIVTFSGSSAQSIQGTESFNKLIIANSAGVTLTGGDVTVNKELTLTSGDVTLGNYNFYIGSAATISSSSASSHFVTNGSGTLRKKWPFPVASSFTFPLGDGTNYTTFTITVNSANYSMGAYVSASLTDAKEPNHSEEAYVTRYWTVSASGLSSANYDWSAQYTDADVVGTEADIFAYKWGGSSWEEFNAANTSTNTLTGSGATSFSSFTGRKGIVTLPVELVSFEAYLQGEAALIEWETASEINNEKFIIEKSVDGVNYTILEEVMGAGNSTESLRYTSFDAHLSAGVNYYRIRQVDYDGTTTVSNVQQIIFKKSGSFTVFPNPVANGSQLNISGEGIISVRIFDIAGQLIDTQYQENDNNLVQSSILSKGTYIAVVHNDSGSHSVKFIVK